MGRSTWSLLMGCVLMLAPMTVADAAAPRAKEAVGATVRPAAPPLQVMSGEFRGGLALALDSNGRRHLVAGNARGDLWYATDRTRTWTARRLLTGKPGWWRWAYPAIAIDEDDRVHVAAVQDELSTPGDTGGIYYLSDRGRAAGDFGPETRIAGRSMTSPSLRVVDGVRYLAYARCLCVPMQRNAPLYFKTDRSGSWRTERIASLAYDPSLRVDVVKGSQNLKRPLYGADIGAPCFSYHRAVSPFGG